MFVRGGRRRVANRSAWLVTRYEDCRRALTDARLSLHTLPVRTGTSSG